MLVNQVLKPIQARVELRQQPSEYRRNRLDPSLKHTHKSSNLNVRIVLPFGPPDLFRSAPCCSISSAHWKACVTKIEEALDKLVPQRVVCRFLGQQHPELHSDTAISGLQRGQITRVLAATENTGRSFS